MENTYFAYFKDYAKSTNGHKALRTALGKMAAKVRFWELSTQIKTWKSRFDDRKLIWSSLKNYAEGCSPPLGKRRPKSGFGSFLRKLKLGNRDSMTEN